MPGAGRGKGKPFQPGQTPGPGRPPLPEDLKKARKQNKILFARILMELIDCTEPELEALALSPETKMLEKMMVSLMLEAHKKGDPIRIEMLLNRMIGKVKDETELLVKPGVKVIDLSLVGKEIVLGKEEDSG